MNPEQLGKVAVLLGGSSAEREVSLMSGNAVLAALQQAGVNAFAFDTAKQNLFELKTHDTDRVFIALHGRGGEDGTVQGALEFLGIPYTGSGVLGSALAMDKVKCKYLFKANQLPTADFVVIRKGKEFDPAQIMTELGSVMVKPAHEGSSIGMSKALTATELMESVNQAFMYDDTVLLEKWITGREFTMTVLAGVVQPVIEMVTPRGFYDYEAKYQVNTTQYHCPADISEAQTKLLQEYAIAAFDLVGASGWGRVDAMQDDNGDIYILEVNTVPGMTEKSLVPMAAKANGISFQQLVLNIIEQTIEH